MTPICLWGSYGCARVAAVADTMGWSPSKRIWERGSIRGLRVGIGRREGAREITGHVLGRFGSTEADLVDKVLTVAANQAEAWLMAGIQKAMNQFNGVVDGARERKTKISETIRRPIHTRYSG